MIILSNMRIIYLPGYLLLFMQAEIINLNDDIKAKNDQIAELGKQILDFVMTSHDALDKSDIVQVDYPFFKYHTEALNFFVLAFSSVLSIICRLFLK